MASRCESDRRGFRKKQYCLLACYCGTLSCGADRVIVLFSCQQLRLPEGNLHQNGSVNFPLLESQGSFYSPKDLWTVNDYQEKGLMSPCTLPRFIDSYQLLVKDLTNPHPHQRYIERVISCVGTDIFPSLVQLPIKLSMFL